ncbi:MAG: 3-deoxy-7-phosphoheptulonate synthase [Planctomycetes bacterium]|nr:3-deoxy-7-phosphoheptulonate synthase [Planctomycetota bacterium]
MLIVMKQGASASEIDAVTNHLRDLGLTAQEIPGQNCTLLGVSGGDVDSVDLNTFRTYSGVQQVLNVTSPFKLSGREYKRDDTIVSLPGRPAVKFGGRKVVVIAGPCSVEGRGQALALARELKAAGVNVMRGGLFKPRTSPFSFQGLEDEGFRILEEIRALGMKFVTEAVDEHSLEMVEAHADMIQIGARNMQNFSLLKRVGKSRLPVMLKRGMSATLEDLLMAADYILSGGNANVVLCERGIRTFARHTRNTLDLSLIPAIKELSHLPIIVDPSHATGDRRYVPPMALAAIAAGADGVMVEVHSDPNCALSDGAQSLYPAQFRELLPQMRAVAQAVGREI